MVSVLYLSCISFSLCTTRFSGTVLPWFRSYAFLPNPSLFAPPDSPALFYHGFSPILVFHILLSLHHQILRHCSTMVSVVCFSSISFSLCTTRFSGTVLPWFQSYTFLPYPSLFAPPDSPALFYHGFGPMLFFHILLSLHHQILRHCSTMVSVVCFCFHILLSLHHQILRHCSTMVSVLYLYSISFSLCTTRFSGTVLPWFQSYVFLPYTSLFAPPDSPALFYHGFSPIFVFHVLLSLHHQILRHCSTMVSVLCFSSISFSLCTTIFSGTVLPWFQSYTCIPYPSLFAPPDSPALFYHGFSRMLLLPYTSLFAPPDSPALFYHGFSPIFVFHVLLSLHHQILRHCSTMVSVLYLYSISFSLCTTRFSGTFLPWFQSYTCIPYPSLFTPPDSPALFCHGFSPMLFFHVLLSLHHQILRHCSTMVSVLYLYSISFSLCTTRFSGTVLPWFQSYTCIPYPSLFAPPDSPALFYHGFCPILVFHVLLSLHHQILRHCSTMVSVLYLYSISFSLCTTRFSGTVLPWFQSYTCIPYPSLFAPPDSPALFYHGFSRMLFFHILLSLHHQILRHCSTMVSVLYFSSISFSLCTTRFSGTVLPWFQSYAFLPYPSLFAPPDSPALFYHGFSPRLIFHILLSLHHQILRHCSTMVSVVCFSSISFSVCKTNTSFTVRHKQTSPNHIPASQSFLSTLIGRIAPNRFNDYHYSNSLLTITNLAALNNPP